MNSYWRSTGILPAKDYDEAVEIAKGCPIIQYGAIVEVRMAIPAA
ncbi:hypothetical protein [Agriterribacter sp.]|nr:hypothetical protein [Agriterribacter sp.]HRP54541.1 hypothetical protein [Agriterribacter sp.]